MLYWASNWWCFLLHLLAHFPPNLSVHLLAISQSVSLLAVGPIFGGVVKLFLCCDCTFIVVFNDAKFIHYIPPLLFFFFFDDVGAGISAKLLPSVCWCCARLAAITHQFFSTQIQIVDDFQFLCCFRKKTHFRDWNSMGGKKGEPPQPFFFMDKSDGREYIKSHCFPCFITISYQLINV